MSSFGAGALWNADECNRIPGLSNGLPSIMNNNEYMHKFEMIFTFQFLISFTFALLLLLLHTIWMHCHNRTIFFPVLCSLSPFTVHILRCWRSSSLSLTWDWLRIGVMVWNANGISLANESRSFILMPYFLWFGFATQLMRILCASPRNAKQLVMALSLGHSYW